MAEMGGFEQRVRWLEAAARNLASAISDILKRLARVEQQVLAAGQGGRGGGSGPTIAWAYCASPISAAGVTGSAPALTLTPASGSAYVATGRASGTWVLPGSTTTIFNDWPGASGVAAAHWVQVYQDPADSSWRILGEQCP